MITAAVTHYVLHFIFPLLVVFLICLRNLTLFKQYAAGFLILSYSVYAPYLAVPDASLVRTACPVLSALFVVRKTPSFLRLFAAHVLAVRSAAIYFGKDHLFGIAPAWPQADKVTVIRNFLAKWTIRYGAESG